MDLVNLIIQMISRLWDYIARHAYYINELQENLNSLASVMDELRTVRNDVKRRVNLAEGQQMRPRNQVEVWLQMVESMEREVDEIVQGSHQVTERCLGGYCPKNCCASYKLGKRITQTLKGVAELRSRGDFSDVADRLPMAPVEAMPSKSTVGMELIFEKVWRGLIEEDEVGVIGLYGMGGVGKTTLLKKINNQFLHQVTHDFDVVIWVTVSKESNVGRVQKYIGERLGLSLLEDTTLDARATRIFDVLSKKKFVLLLDDIWEPVDLDIVGIPYPDKKNKSKVVFTTRSEAVCGRMDAQKFKLECLGWDEAWDLFQKMVGKKALNSHPEIAKLATIVAKECAGLPLALITVGRTMASKKTPQEWNHAITVLHKSASEFSGMGDEVFPLLKFSYDSLPNDTIRSCFLYCSLFPEDYSIHIEELIHYWIGEGLVDGFNDMSEARNQGYDIIGTLKLACLLESGVDEYADVKMHDVVRDLALWIACECGRRRDKFLVQARVGLIEAPEVDKWKEAEKISLMVNGIKELTQTPTCFNLLTLLINRNTSLGTITDGFFKFMPTLRVLDLSWTSVRDLPKEIFELVELQFLNLSRTRIGTLPRGMKNLVKLRYLGLSRTLYLTKIPIEVISRLPRLQVLDLYDGSFEDWEVEGGATLGELESLKHLKALGINIKTVPTLQRFFKSHTLPNCTVYLCIKECHGLTSIPLSISSASTLGNMKHLQVFNCCHCLDLEELTISWIVGDTEKVVHSSLERVLLRNLPKLKIIRGAVPYLCLQNLRSVLVDDCDALKDLTWLLGVRSLERLVVSNCKGIKEVICGEFTAAEEGYITFSRLKSIRFNDLPKLKSINSHALSFPFLEKIEVNDCPKLNKLPLDSNSAKNTLKWIKGQKKWLEELEWEDITTKSVFLPYFKSY